MSIRNLILGVNSVTVSHLIHYDSLLQNATAILLQNVTQVYCKMCQVFITKCDSFITKRTVIIKCDDFITKWTVITKCDVYYKLRQYKQTLVFIINFYHLNFVLLVLFFSVFI